MTTARLIDDITATRLEFTHTDRGGVEWLYVLSQHPFNGMWGAVRRKPNEAIIPPFMQQLVLLEDEDDIGFEPVLDGGSPTEWEDYLALIDFIKSAI
ncbi:MAG: hypothetical protein KJO36_04280 [Acidimicrobiia bacterium]|nr:hypothetical protein [Acidimicrobiia bacterium]